MTVQVRLAMPGDDHTKAIEALALPEGGKIAALQRKTHAVFKERLRPQEWKSGERLWVVEVIAPSAAPTRW